MKIPYNVLHVNGSVLFAARGGKLHSFSLQDGTHISTWKHSDVDRVDTAVKANSKAMSTLEDENAMNIDSEPAQSDEPPAKRQRVEPAKNEEEDKKNDVGSVPNETEPAAPGEDAGKDKGKGGKKSKNRQNNERSKEGHISRVPDRPVITHLASTQDGQYIVAITGHDKNVWVFEHDGKGILKELSKRTMPKRPSSVAVGPDSQIIYADKFGDVYALPVLVAPSDPSSNPPARTISGVPKPAFKPSANNLTVHSKRNLRALTNQQRHAERSAKAEAEGKAGSGLDFDLTLLLGHVSMLTSVTLGESEGRTYIITGDRDEHIRVSRYLPQAYVIEGFCLGHKEFVNTMIIPASRKDVLVSGGGDEEVYVWDWKNSKLVSKANLLSLAQLITPESTKVAVSGFSSLVYNHHTYIAAICEDLPAIFTWQLTPENTLNHPGIIQLPGNPLDIAVEQSSSPRIIVAVDPGETGQANNLSIFTLTDTDGKLSTDSTVFLDDGKVVAEELEITEKEVRSLLYNVESMRKQATEQDDEADGEVQGKEVAHEAE